MQCRIFRNISCAMQDILYDPQTSGGLLAALPKEESEDCLKKLRTFFPEAEVVGYVTEKEDFWIYLE